jgi:ABC-type branched-subunit amino acid transport system permease subunit/ABC-type branched-subunit amino acid transport system ATPase component
MKRSQLIAAGLMLFAVGAPLVLPAWLLTVLNYAGLFGLVTIGLSLLTGVAGLTSFGQAAFVGIGAYTTAALTTKFGISPWLTLWIGLIASMATALVLGLLTLRLGGHYLPLGTIAWGLNLYFLVGNVDTLGGHTGIGDIPPLVIFGFPINTDLRFYYVVLPCVLGAALLVENLLSSREGRAIRCVRGVQAMAEAMGINTERSKLAAFVIAAMLASLSGWLYAHLQRFVNPTPFGITSSIEYLFMTVIGGAGFIWGAVLGAGIVTLLREALTDFLPRFGIETGNYEVLISSIVTIILLHRAPEGLWPWLSFGKRSRPNDAPQMNEPIDLARRPETSLGRDLLNVRDVSKRFGGLVAVDGVSLTVGAREIVGLLGPNGAGKTTMFNLILGGLEPTDGEIAVLGHHTARIDLHKISRLGVGRTFQHVKLLPRLSVLENVAIGAHARASAGLLRSALHLERHEERHLLAEARRQLERVGLADRIREPAGNLSLGEQRLLEIARALASNPLLLLLDEPAAGLRYHEKQALAILVAMGVLLAGIWLSTYFGRLRWRQARKLPQRQRGFDPLSPS